MQLAVAGNLKRREVKVTVLWAIRPQVGQSIFARTLPPQREADKASIQR
jgi:hypothetical protein